MQTDTTPPRHVLMIASEAVPFAKTGGLADVLGALPSALTRLGWQVTVALPRYRGVTAGHVVDQCQIRVGGVTREIGCYEAAIAEGARAWLIDCPGLFDREALYGVGGTDYPDSPVRFATLVRAALECSARQVRGPSLVHAHDWQAALAPVYLRTMYETHPVLGGTPTVFTIHNLAYQGVFEADWLPRLDLPWQLLDVERLEYWGRISLLKGGINHADLITTVSPQYAREIQTPEGGFGFDGVLRRRASDLVGILNGIDAEAWDPASDPSLPAHYDADDLTGKETAKREVLSRYGLKVSDETMRRPLVGMISRLVDQKGFDLLGLLGDALADFDATWIVLGTGDPRYQQWWTDLAGRHSTRVGVRIGFDEALAHLIEGGADLFLMPSRFEPCGLNQMYSLRYGTVPVVHGVGGLLDTVHDDPSDPSASTGFVFREYTASALVAALTRAFAAFADRPRWQALQRAGMRQDNSWDRSAREYVTMYERALRVRGQRAVGAR